MTREELKAIIYETETRKVKYREYKNKLEEIKGIKKGSYFADTKEIEIIANKNIISIEILVNENVVTKFIIFLFEKDIGAYKIFDEDIKFFDKKEERKIYRHFSTNISERINEAKWVYNYRDVSTRKNEEDIFDLIEDFQKNQNLDIGLNKNEFNVQIQVKVENFLEIMQQKNEAWEFTRGFIH